MSDVVKQLERSAEIVKIWGQSPLPNGKTLEGQLTIDGFSMWEMIAPVMALYYVPVALSTPQIPTFFRLLRPHLSLAKRRLLNLMKCLSMSPCSELKIPSNSKLFLFLGFSGYMYRDVLGSVAENLSQKKGCQSLVIHENSFTGKSRNSTDMVRFDSIWEYWDMGVMSETRRLKQQLAIAIKELQAMQEFPDSIRVGDTPFWFQMKSAFNWIFNFHLQLLLPQIVIAKKILKRHRPALIISADVADARARIFSMVGHQLNIPSLEVQFGSNGLEAVEWRFLVADKIASWGEATRRFLLGHNVLEKKISITGSPRHDYMVNIDISKVEGMRNRLGVPLGNKLLLCASTYQQKEYNSLSNPELLASMKRAVFSASAEVEGVYLVVKPHPLENVLETKKLIRPGHNILFLDPSEDIRELIKSCDVFIGFGSTATMDAMIANKLTICPAFPGWVWSDMFVKSDAVLVPQSEEEVLNTFRRIVGNSISSLKKELDPARLEFLQKWAYKIDGLSSERVATMAIEMTRLN